MNNIHFSIDTDAHVRKLAAGTYKENEYYIVELIRSAIRRNPGRINVNLTHKSVLIEDNGKGLSKEECRNLVDVFSRTISPEKRESAIESLSSGQHLGIIAVFSPEYSKININNVSSVNEKQSISFSKNEVYTKHDTSGVSGTEIKIFRQTPSLKDEIQIVLKYLTKREDSGDSEIFLNGKKVESQGNLSDCMISSKFETDDLCEGKVGIPVIGEVCRIIVTESSIPYSMEMYYPIKGLIFDAVIESSDEINDSHFKSMVKEAVKLYKWLGDYYPKLPLSHRNRLRELFQLHSSKTGDERLIMDLPVYEQHNGKAISLRELLNAEEKGNIYYTTGGTEENHSVSHKNFFLKLTDKDVDYLLNEKKIKMICLNKIKVKKQIGEKLYDLFSSISIKIVNIVDSLYSGKPYLLTSLNEMNFHHELTRAFSKNTKEAIEIRYTSKKGFNPSHFKNRKGKKTLIVHINHSITKKALVFLSQNKNNFDLIWHIFRN